MLNLLEIEIFRRNKENLGYNNIRAILRRVYWICGDIGDTYHSLEQLDKLRNYDMVINILRKKAKTRAIRMANFKSIIKFIELFDELNIDNKIYVDALEFEKIPLQSGKKRKK